MSRLSPRRWPRERSRAAGLDVFEREPEVEPRLLEMQNVVLAPAHRQRFRRYTDEDVPDGRRELRGGARRAAPSQPCQHLAVRQLTCISHHVARAKCVRGPSGRGASRWARATWPLWFFTNHESRDTNHGLFLACFGRRVVRNAGSPQPPETAFITSGLPSNHRRVFGGMPGSEASRASSAPVSTSYHSGRLRNAQRTGAKGGFRLAEGILA